MFLWIVRIAEECCARNGAHHQSVLVFAGLDVIMTVRTVGMMMSAIKNARDLQSYTEGVRWPPAIVNFVASPRVPCSITWCMVGWTGMSPPSLPGPQCYYYCYYCGTRTGERGTTRETGSLSVLLGSGGGTNKHAPTPNVVRCS